MWGSSCSPGPEGCWKEHVLVMWSYLFIGKPPTSESNSALLFIHLQTQMGLAEIAGNQSSVWLMCCCVSRDQGTLSSLSLEQPLPLWTSQFIPLSFPQSQHMLYSQHSNVPWLWEGHQKAGEWPRAAGLSLPGFTFSPDLCKSKSAFSVWSANTIDWVISQGPCGSLTETRDVSQKYTDQKSCVPSCLCLKFWWTDLCPWRMSVTLWFTFLEWSLSSHTASSFFHL